MVLSPDFLAWLVVARVAWPFGRLDRRVSPVLLALDGVRCVRLPLHWAGPTAPGAVGLRGGEDAGVSRRWLFSLALLIGLMFAHLVLLPGAPHSAARSDPAMLARVAGDRAGG